MAGLSARPGVLRASSDNRVGSTVVETALGMPLREDVIAETLGSGPVTHPFRPRPSNRSPIAFAAAVVAFAALVVLPAGSFAGVDRSPVAPDAAGPQAAPAAFAAPFVPTVPLSPAYNWPELHDTPLLDGYAANTTLSATNASQLGVAWSTNLYGSALDSPAVAYDPSLKETLAYVGTELGDVVAVNLANGRIIWSIWTGSPIRSSPLVYNGSVYIGTFVNPEILRLNATTGATQARAISPGQLEATPTVATPPGGVPTLYFPTLDSGSLSGPLLALNAANLSTEWAFTGYNQTAGSWDSTSYAVSANGTPMVVFGTDNPDSSIYDVNARTGQLLWRFQCLEPADGDWDVASGVTISLPGVNGFAQGVAYAINKLSYLYALDLNNGTLIWEVNFDALAGHTGGVARSTAALDGTNLVFGYAVGLLDLNASTGALIWDYKDSSSTESLASPAIAGATGHAVVVTGDIAGFFDVVSLATGKPLYSYQTGGYVTGSPAVSDGNVLVASSNGFLYDFAVGGGNDAVLPGASVRAPIEGAILPNPNGSLSIRGTANDSKGVASVEVAIQSGGATGPWWDGTTATWSPGPINNRAVLGTTGARSTSWSVVLPVPRSGGTYEVFANALSTSGQTGLSGSTVNFAVSVIKTGPNLEASASFVAPGGQLTVTGGGFGASASVRLTLGSVTLATLTAHKNGSLPSTKLTVPTNFSFGPAALTGTGPGTNLTSSVTVTVANSWDQLGEGPGHVGYEANDLVYNYLIFPGGNNWERLAWHFEPGGAFDAPPAVVQGVAYVASTSGQLFAVDIHNGGLLWTFTLASGAPIDGSPAVDVARGLVFVGANDGTLDAVDVSNGSLAWADSVGGNVSAPIFANGETYVTSSLGTVEAIAESSGLVTWTDTLTSGITAAAGLNGTADLLVVGESNGNVVGLNSSSGATRWTYAMGGAVTAAPTVSGPSVFVGSSNDKVVALSQSKGAPLWTFQTTGAVQDTGSLSSNRTGGGLTLFIGSNAGILYGITASTGKSHLNVTLGSAIVGVSTANGIAVIETANGKISATRTFVSQLDWTYVTGAGLLGSPVLQDGGIYVAAEDGSLYAFTSEGQAPV
jgi:outer membrane protein assembly factor BamB